MAELLECRELYSCRYEGINNVEIPFYRKSALRSHDTAKEKLDAEAPNVTFKATTHLEPHGIMKVWSHEVAWQQVCWDTASRTLIRDQLDINEDDMEFGMIDQEQHGMNLKQDLAGLPY